MKPVVPVNMISVLKACRNNFVSQFTRMAPPPPPPEKPIPVAVGSTFTGSNNPCLDLYDHHYFVGQDALSTADFYESLKQLLLPLSWSYNPLTALNIAERQADEHRAANRAAPLETEAEAEVETEIEEQGQQISEGEDEEENEGHWRNWKWNGTGVVVSQYLNRRKKSRIEDLADQQDLSYTEVRRINIKK